MTTRLQVFIIITRARSAYDDSRDIIALSWRLAHENTSLNLNRGNERDILVCATCRLHTKPVTALSCHCTSFERTKQLLNRRWTILMGETINGAIDGPHGVVNLLASLEYCVHFHISFGGRKRTILRISQVGERKINPKAVLSSWERAATENESHLFIEWIFCWCRLFAAQRTTQYCNDRSQLFIFYIRQMCLWMGRVGPK